MRSEPVNSCSELLSATNKYCTPVNCSRPPGSHQPLIYRTLLAAVSLSERSVLAAGQPDYGDLPEAGFRIYER